MCKYHQIHPNNTNLSEAHTACNLTYSIIIQNIDSTIHRYLVAASDDEISHSIDSSFIKLRKWIIDNINARKILIRDEITHQWIIKTKVSLQGVC